MFSPVGSRPDPALADIRSRILDGAVELLQSGALLSMSMRQVAEAIGVSRKSLYNHFSGKADLVGEAVAAGMERIVASLSEIAADRSRGYVERLDRIVEHGFRETDRILSLVPAGNPRVVPLELQRSIRDIRRHIHALIESVVSEGAELGLIDPHLRPDLLSEVLVNMINGIRLREPGEILSRPPLQLLRASLRLCLVGALSDRGRDQLAASQILAREPAEIPSVAGDGPNAPNSSTAPTAGAPS